MFHVVWIVVQPYEFTTSMHLHTFPTFPIPLNSSTKSYLGPTFELQVISRTSTKTNGATWVLSFNHDSIEGPTMAIKAWVELKYGSTKLVCSNWGPNFRAFHLRQVSHNRLWIWTLHGQPLKLQPTPELKHLSHVVEIHLKKEIWNQANIPEIWIALSIRRSDLKKLPSASTAPCASRWRDTGPCQMVYVERKLKPIGCIEIEFKS